MTKPNPETVLRDSTVRELLLSYLLHVEGQLWPGADALTLDDLVRAYPRVAATGRVPVCKCSKSSALNNSSMNFEARPLMLPSLCPLAFVPRNSAEGTI